MPKTLTTNELTVLGRVDILCDALEKDYENDNIRLHESSLRDEMHYSPYHEEQLAAIERNGLVRFITGLDEYAPEVQNLPAKFLCPTSPGAE